MVPRLPPLPRAGELGGCCPATSGSGSHIFFALSSNQRKLEAQGSAEATWGQEVQSTQCLAGVWATRSRCRLAQALLGKTSLCVLSGHGAILTSQAGPGSSLPESPLALNEEGAGGWDSSGSPRNTLWSGPPRGVLADGPAQGNLTWSADPLVSRSSLQALASRSRLTS